MSTPLRGITADPPVRAVPRARPRGPPPDPSQVRPPVLVALLEASDAEAKARTWERFLDAYSGLLMQCAFHSGRTYDGGMDRYAFVLDQLRKDDFHRLRQFRATGAARFTTWLVVVARRLCLDHARQRYGRHHGASGAARESMRAIRRRLADLGRERIEVCDLADDSGRDPDTLLAAVERTRAIDSVLRRLDPRSLLLLRLRFGQDLTAREIGELMSYPSPFHVYRELRALLARIRPALLAAGVDGSWS